jgi:hypothetical protein
MKNTFLISSLLVQVKDNNFELEQSDLTIIE